MVLAIFYTWLHNNTNGSVLIAALFHAVSNTAAAAIPFWTSDFGRWVDFGILLLLAGIVLWRWRMVQKPPPTKYGIEKTAN